MPKKDYHLVVLGAGSGGLVAAAGAAGLGARVALIEKHRMGGDCLNTGCVPSKAIIRTAKLAHDLRRASHFGLQDFSVDVSLDRVMASVREVQAKIAPHDSVERFQALGVDVYQGFFRFFSREEVTDGDLVIRGRRFVIATGARPYCPSIKGLENITYYTSDTIWNLQHLPRRLVVLGGGPIGCELGQVFARLGTQVVIVEMGSFLLGREDVEASEVLETQFRREGIEIHKQCQVVEVGNDPQGIKIMMQGKKGTTETYCDTLLLALGRAPNVDALNLEKACVEYTRRGIVVDDYLKTTNEIIYACGDVCGPYQFTHTADFQARLILRNALFPGNASLDLRVVPWCTFTEPEVARVGLNEREARERNMSYDLYHYSLKELDRALCDREANGFIKVLTRKGSDRILGVTLVGPHAGDLIHELVLAMHQNIGLKKLVSMIHIYPTLAEVSKRIADTYNRSRLTKARQNILKVYFKIRFGG